MEYIDMHLLLLTFNAYCLLLFYRNTTTTTVEQELVFVGNEEGKLIAMRDLVKKVNVITYKLQKTYQCSLFFIYF